MEPIDSTTFSAEGKDHFQTIVGDETQKKFLPRIKIKRWNNEANFSLGLNDTTGKGRVKNNKGTVEYSINDMTARFYELTKDQPQPLQKIRRVLKGDELKAIEATSEYELFNHIYQPGEFYLAHYVVTEPSLSTFDLMPADVHLDVDDKGMVKDYDYKDKSAYHPSDIPMPKYDRIKLCRFYTPYTPTVNPYYMDDGIHNIDMQWAGTSLGRVTEQLKQAIEGVLNKRNIETKQGEGKNADKLYFKHNSRWVKFFSAQGESNALYSYINIGSSYNKAYDFYRPDVEKDIRDQYAYGLSFAYKDITHDIVDEIMQAFAKLLKVPLENTPYTEDEKIKWQTIQNLQDNIDWNAKAVRKDASWHRTIKDDGFEFEVVFNSKPLSNEVELTASVPKGVTAFYQAELPFDQTMKEGVKRRPNIHKSLAIYLTDETKCGTTSYYKTGKLAHIHRPIAHDSSGYSVFCDFKELEGLKEAEQYDLSKGLTVIVPQEFLDNAVYPVTVDPTFGYNAAGGSTAATNNTILGTGNASPSTGRYLSSISAFVDVSGSSTSDLQLAFYNETGAAVSTFTFVQRTDSYTNVGGAASWVPLAMSNPAYHIASHTYVLAIWGTDTVYSTAATIAYDGTAGTSYSLASTYSAGNWPTNLTGATTQATRRYSIFANTGYQYPIMVNASSAMASSSTVTYQSVAAHDSNGWSTNINSNQSIAPVTFDLTKFYFTLSSAPGTGTQRNISVYDAGTAVSPSIQIVDTATTGSDTLYADMVSAGNTIEIINDPGGTTPAASTSNLWLITQTSTNQALFAASNTAASTSATNYMGVSDTGLQTVSTSAEQVMPEAGSFQNMYASLTSGTLSSGSYTVVINVAGSDSTQSVVLDSTHQTRQTAGAPVSFSAGDKVYIKITPSTPSASRMIGVGVEYVTANTNRPGNGVLLSSIPANASNSATVYSHWYGSPANWRATRLDAYGAPVYITDMYVLISAACGVGASRAVTFLINAADTDASVTISGASATTGSWHGSVPVNLGDALVVKQVPTATPTAATVKFGIVFNSNPTFPNYSSNLLTMMAG